MASNNDDQVEGHYDDTNRAFLQAFMARGTMTLKEAKPILAAIFTAHDGQDKSPTLPENVTEADFKSYIAAATAALSPFDYEIRSTIHQVSKERIWAIINSTSDPITQMATTRSPDEIAYMKRLLDAMFETNNTPRQEIMGVTSMQALKAAKGGAARQSVSGAGDEGASQAADKGLTSSQVEKLLASLVEEAWLERSKEGWYTLSARALMELRGWLVATYNEPDAEEDEWQRIKFCVACKSIVTVGQRCAEVDCNARLHDVCQAAFWRTRPGKACPECEKEWDGRHWVGERAITTGEAYLRGKRRSGGPPRRDVVENEENNEGEEGEES